MKKIKDSSGVIALEATIVLTLFICLISFLYSFFIIYDAQGAINHALIQTAQSMSIDSYATDKLIIDEFPADTNDLLTTFGFDMLTRNENYTSTTRWYNDKTEDDWYKGDTPEEELAAQNADFMNVVRTRFVAYLTAEGDNTSAKNFLNSVNVVDGLSGLDFDESYVDYSNGDLYITVKYKSKFIFDFSSFGISELEFKQTAVSHLWRA